VTVRVTGNFERNLTGIQAFLAEQGAPDEVFGGLLDRLFDVVVPNLERFPEIGADSLLRRAPLSVQGVARQSALLRRLGEGVVLREYVVDEYLVLYAVHAHVDLLAIRHHRQLSFDLRAFW
jgi:hypothetical protein